MNFAIARPSPLNVRTSKALPFWAACFGVAAIASFAVFSGGGTEPEAIRSAAAVSSSSESIAAPSAPAGGSPAIQVVERRCDALAAADASTRDLLEAFGYC